MRVDAAVFAYNEARTIERAVGSLLRNDQVARVTILVNGCTDNTEEVVERLTSREERVQSANITVGDKCNVWNLYVHEIADLSADLHLFMDGDCYCHDNAVDAFTAKLNSDSDSIAFAAVPMSGRNRDEYIQLQQRLHWLFGNLYAVATRQLVALREHAIRLPIGLKGNDHFITKIMQTSFGDQEKRTAENVAICDSAGYCFDSLQPFRFQDMKTYWNRMVTYDLRQRQIPVLNPLPLAELPETVDEVNQQILRDLQNERLVAPAARATRAKLRRMYPEPDSAFYRSRFGLTEGRLAECR